MPSTRRSSKHDEQVQHFPRTTIDLPWNLMQISEPTTSQPMEVDQQTDNRTAMAAIPSSESLLPEIQQQIDTLPAYLHRKNGDFQRLLCRLCKSLPSASTSTMKKKLCLMARYVYRMLILQTYQDLWSVYLRSGQGRLVSPASKNYCTTVPFWPKAVQQLTNTKDPRVCQTLAQNQVDLCLYHYERTKNELNNQGHALPGYTLAIQTRIESYVEERLRPWHRQIRHERQLVFHQYHIYAIKVAFLQMNPTKDQERWMQQFCGATYKQEESVQQHQYLTEQIDLFRTRSLSMMSWLQNDAVVPHSIPNERVREAFLRECYPTVQQAGTTLCEIYLQHADQQRITAAEQYRLIHAQLEEHRQAQRLPDIMFQLILARCDRITRRLRFIYTFKRESLPTKSFCTD